MISRIQLLRNVGQFNSVDAGRNLPLTQFVLIYAENGRGKTTLAAILRSLASGDPIPIVERRRLAAQHPPHVVLDCGQVSPVMFQDGSWNSTVPDIAIFDDDFVDDNVCSGLTVDPEHRHNLHELVLGSQGVALNRQLQGLTRQVEVHNAELRAIAAEIPSSVRGALSVDDFCELPRRSDVDAAIQVGERNLAAARAQDSVRATPQFDPLGLPSFDLAELSQKLALDPPTLDAAAAARVQAHLARLGSGGEAWVEDGIHRASTLDGERRSCPFCAQDLAGSSIIGHYQSYFGEEYARLRRSLSDAVAGVNELHSRDAPANFERAVRIATQRQQFWSRFTEIGPVALDTEILARSWQNARHAVLSALSAKQAAPLERLEIPTEVVEAVAAFEVQRSAVAELNERLQSANDAIRLVKREAATANPTVIETSLQNLRVVKRRHSPPISNICEEYLRAKQDKGVTERARDAAKAALERYRTAAFPSYETAINAYLSQFNAGYRVGRVSPADSRGGPICNYSLVINNTPVAVAGGAITPGVPSFRNVLSPGDRNTLALSFFFASMDQDPGLARKVIIVDDPISSLDHHRAFTTVQVLRRLGRRVSQIIILSHNKPFLFRVWDGIDAALRTSLKIDRDANGSTITPWDVEGDSITEHDRRHEMLRTYSANGQTGDSRQVAESLRIVLEGFLSVACPEHYPKGRRAWLNLWGVAENDAAVPTRYSMHAT